MDVIFLEHIGGIEMMFKALSVPEQLRIEQWVQKLRAMPSSPETNLIRNQYSGLLFNAVRSGGGLVDPFTSYPPVETLPPLRTLMGSVSTDLLPGLGPLGLAPRPGSAPGTPARSATPAQSSATLRGYESLLAAAALSSGSGDADGRRARLDVHAARESGWALRGYPGSSAALHAGGRAQSLLTPQQQHVSQFSARSSQQATAFSAHRPAAASGRLSCAPSDAGTGYPGASGELHRLVLPLESAVSLIRTELLGLGARLEAAELGLADSLGQREQLVRRVAQLEETARRAAVLERASPHSRSGPLAQEHAATGQASAGATLLRHHGGGWEKSRDYGGGDYTGGGTAADGWKNGGSSPRASHSLTAEGSGLGALSYARLAEAAARVSRREEGPGWSLQLAQHSEQPLGQPQGDERFSFSAPYRPASARAAENGQTLTASGLQQYAASPLAGHGMNGAPSSSSQAFTWQALGAAKEFDERVGRLLADRSGPGRTQHWEH